MTEPHWTRWPPHLHALLGSPPRPTVAPPSLWPTFVRGRGGLSPPAFPPATGPEAERMIEDQQGANGMSQTERGFIVAVALLVGTAVPSLAAALTGNDWWAYPEGWKLAYIEGVVDAHLGIGLAIRAAIPVGELSVSDKTLMELSKCLERAPRPSGQLRATVEKYMKDHSGEWQNNMAGLVFNALEAECKK